MRKENKEMMKKINDQHERRGQNEERKIEVMTQLVEAMKKTIGIMMKKCDIAL